MKKTILLTITIWGCINSIYSQSVHENKANSFNKQDSINQTHIIIEPKPEHVYVIFTSQEYDPKNEDGITEGVMRIKTFFPYHKEPGLISYTFLSKSKNFEFDFSHWNFNLEDVKKIRPVEPNDKMNIVRVSKKFLSKIKPIDLDKKGPSMTKEEALALRDRLVKKVIWLIDRRDITRDSVKLIQAETQIPSFF